MERVGSDIDYFKWLKLFFTRSYKIVHDSQAKALISYVSKF